MASHLVGLLTDTYFEIIIFRRYIKSHAECKYVATEMTRVLMEKDGFRRILVRGDTTRKNRCDTLKLDYVTEVLLKAG